MMGRSMAEPEQRQTPISSDRRGVAWYPGDSIPWKDVPAYARKIARGLCWDGFAHLEDDIAQEAELRLFEHSDQVKTSWKGVLRTTVANVARDLIRREIRQRRIVGEYEAAQRQSPRAEPEAAELAVANEIESKLESLLIELDVQFGLGTRAIVDLRTANVPWKVIATDLDIPLRTCSDRHCKAEAWLRQQLSLPPLKGGHHE
jgi:DNA-directed RNA polymerase specialized sigma24 family protein